MGASGTPGTIGTARRRYSTTAGVMAGLYFVMLSIFVCNSHSVRQLYWMLAHLVSSGE